jgi:hypothetical protein
MAARPEPIDAYLATASDDRRKVLHSHPRPRPRPRELSLSCAPHTERIGENEVPVFSESVEDETERLVDDAKDLRDRLEARSRWQTEHAHRSGDRGRHLECHDGDSRSRIA